MDTPLSKLIGPEEEEQAEAYSQAQFWNHSDLALFTCPFDPSHKIRRFRVERHLLACAKNNPDVKVATCPYNATHVLPLKLYVEHISRCPDVRLVDGCQGNLQPDFANKSRLYKKSIGMGLQPADRAKYSRFVYGYSANLVAEDEKRSGSDFGSSVPKPDVTDSIGNKSYDLKKSMMGAFRNQEERNYIEENVVAGGYSGSMYAHGGLPTDLDELDEAIRNGMLDVMSETCSNARTPIFRTPSPTAEPVSAPTANPSTLEQFVAIRRAASQNSERSGSAASSDFNSTESAPF